MRHAAAPLSHVTIFYILLFISSFPGPTIFSNTSNRLTGKALEKLFRIPRNSSRKNESFSFIFFVPHSIKTRNATGSSSGTNPL
jgi:hypothetical protein